MEGVMKHLIMTLVILFVISSSVFAITWHVPSECETIQAGIDSAASGDTVLIAIGIYTGPGNRDLDFNGKAIVVKGANGPHDTVIDCEKSGRGFYFHNSETNNSKLEGLTVRNGFVGEGYAGGGISCEGSSFLTCKPTIVNCVIQSSEANFGGGLYCHDGSPTLIDCVIEENSVSGTGCGGGGMFFESYKSAPVLTNCLISGNYSAYSGGGMSCWNASPAFEDCIFEYNTANHYMGGGIYCYLSSPAIVNCLFVYNEASSKGGGIYCTESSPSIMHCTFSANSASWGGGLYCMKDSSPLVIDCIFWGDTEDEIYTSGGNPQFYYCDIQGGWTGIGIIDEDPLFAGGEDFHLTASSPCIDSGIEVGIFSDMDDEARPMGLWYDMGADEFTNTSETPLVVTCSNYPSTIRTKETLQWDIEIYNPGPIKKTFTTVGLTVTGPLSTELTLLTRNFTIKKDRRLTGTARVPVPGFAPEGLYTLCTHVDYCNIEYGADEFQVEVIP
jgi:predicted outer membrane repeat protein